jgi:hypothetical protein
MQTLEVGCDRQSRNSDHPIILFFRIHQIKFDFPSFLGKFPGFQKYKQKLPSGNVHKLRNAQGGRGWVNDLLRTILKI